MNSPNPALVSQREAEPLPRVALFVLCAAYVLPGLVGRDPWKSADITSFGYSVNIASGRTGWLAPTVGGVPADGALLPSLVTVWTAGFGVPDLAARSGLRTDALGRLLTDETLTSVDDPRIVAAGDAAAPSGQPLRMSCQAAIPLGAQAANTVLSRIAGTPPAVVNQAFTGQCVSLGRSYATFQLARPDDTPVNLAIGGRVAASIKEAVCKGTVWGIRREAAKPGWYRWLKGGKRSEQLAAADTVSVP